MHSTASDGRLSPEEVMVLAHEMGLEMVALTDHDTVHGIVDARRAAFRLGMGFLNGCEVSSKALGTEVHLLAYGFNLGHSGLDAFLLTQQQRRNDRAAEFISRLKKTGDLPPDSKPPVPQEGKSIARPHSAKMLIDAGTVTDFADAFQRFLTPGCKHFVPKPLPDGREVVDVVHAAGGVVVLAHPGHQMPHRVVLQLFDAGLDGIEVVHPSHDENLEIYYRDLAYQHSKFITGGSDFHGQPKHGGMTLGDYWIKPGPEILNMTQMAPAAPPAPTNKGI
ncbi:MAG: PHP domain-containing protein [Bacteroidetes bacterium]|nr:PHP domain-containing protein [Bacteroidota bacterium]